MATTKITTNSLADSAVTSEKLASSISIDNLSVSGNLTVDTNTLFVDAANNRVGVGTTSPSARLHTISTTEQIRFGYDVSNYWNATTSSTGVTTLSAAGSGAKFVFAKDVEFSANATIPDVIGNTSFADDVEVLGDVIVGSGKVGIGTASPSESLTVVGNISASGNITANNLVYTSENQSISGVKTFNDLPIIPITPTSNDNPTSKEYVDSLVSSVSSSIQDSLLDIITNSSSVFSLSSIYNNKVVQCTSTTPITAILPASLPQGFNCMLIQLSSGQINIQGDSGVTVGSFGSLVKTAGQHAPVSIICLAPGIYNVSGNLI